VSSFASAFEKFYEFYLEVMAYKNNKTTAQFDEALKP
jgi:hypothetical protein